jgi:hypothetical protein
LKAFRHFSNENIGFTYRFLEHISIWNSTILYLYQILLNTELFNIYDRFGV